MSGCRIGKVTPKLGVVQPMPYPVNTEAEQYLEYTLNRVKSGEFRSVAVAAVNAQGHVHTGYSIAYRENPVLLYGAVGWVGQRIMESKVMEGRI